MPISEMVIVWTIACGGQTVQVFEDGRVESEDSALRDRLLAHLREPVDVSETGGDGVEIVMQPDDRRYVVARVRRLVRDAEDLEIVSVHFTGPAQVD